MSKYNVQGFPTILVFGADKESPVPYQGARVASAIESFALEQLEANSAPPEVSELTGPDVMEEKCASAAICFVSFLPDILDSKAEGRNKYLDLLFSVAEKFKKNPYRQVSAELITWIYQKPFSCYYFPKKKKKKNSAVRSTLNTGVSFNRFANRKMNFYSLKVAGFCIKY
uniref:PDIL2-3 n=1 Tax=Arundo donax TaxID=35708 RepID=A0A0A9CPU1_ARUDO